MPVLRVATIVFAFCLAAPAGAATFVANNLSDLNDNNPGDGVCNVGDGSCSFRAAAQEANALPGPDTIELVAGTHMLSQTYTCGGPTCGLYVELRPNVEVVGQGIGTTILHGADISYSGPVIQANVYVGDTGDYRFSNLSMDPGTFAGFGGDYANQMIGLTNFNCASCAMVLDGVVLDILHTSDAGGSSALNFSGIGPSEVRNTTINVSGGANPSPAGINVSDGAELLVEDFTMNGGNSANAAIAYRASDSAFGGPELLTVRRSRFVGVGAAGGAAIFLTNINIPEEMDVLVEDSEFVNVARGINLRNWGTLPGTTHLTIERSLFTGVSGEALRLSGPCVATLRNSTVSSATTGVALIAPENGGTGTCDVTLDSSTIAGGTTSVAVGSGFGTVAARNSILADAATAACTGTLNSLGYNLIEGSCTVAGDTTGNITGMDPMLDAPADNGGPTQTRALMAGSPAIDAGDAGNCPVLDQRGFSRPADGDGNLSEVCDIGAFEKDAVAPPSNSAPVAQDDGADVDEDGSVTIDVAANDSDTDGNLVPGSANTSCGGCSEPTQGTLQDNGDGSFDYSPDPDYHGADGFTYEICDSEGLCDTAVVAITVNPVNDPPVADDDAASLDEDLGIIMGAPSLRVNDDDPDGDALTVSDASGTTGQGGSFACDASACSYNPVADFFGSDSFDYEVCDDGTPVLCDTATITITVNPVNDAPSFLPGPAQVFAGGSSGAQSISGWASMIDPGPGEGGQSVQAFELALLSDPEGVVAGLPVIDAAGNLGFTLSGAPGLASFEVRLRDDGGTANGGVDVSSAALLSIAVGTAADVSVSIQQCSGQAAPGELYAYAMRVDNAGPDAAVDVVLDAPLPAGASIDAIGNADCLDAGSSVACHFGQLAAGVSVAVPVVLLMPGGGPELLDLSATISSGTEDGNAANDSAAATVLLAPGLILDSGFESCDGEGG